MIVDLPVADSDVVRAVTSMMDGNDVLRGGDHDDLIFGQLGDDAIQGDGSISSRVAGGGVHASRAGDGTLLLEASFETAADGDDYIEGNGGADDIYGGLGQDDIIGGQSGDLIFGDRGRVLVFADQALSFDPDTPLDTLEALAVSAGLGARKVTTTTRVVLPAALAMPVVAGLDAGRFGRIVMGTVRVRWCRPQAYYDQDPWRGTWAEDGGVFSNQASHHGNEQKLNNIIVVDFSVI